MLLWQLIMLFGVDVVVTSSLLRRIVEFAHLVDPPRARPRDVPRAIPLALGSPRPLGPPLPARLAGAGVEYLLDGFELVGGCSTKLVSVVL